MATLRLKRRPVLLCGPTASGKSELALRIAERDSGAIINADALQVYDCWRVLTARPGQAALARAPHYLDGHVAADVRYSVGAWLRDLAAVLEALDRRGARAIIVGGTGLYFTALINGIAEIPDIPPEVRTHSQVMLDAGRINELLADLERRDRRTYDYIDRANPMRVQRAWEVLEATNRGLVAWHSQKTEPVIPEDACEKLVLQPDISFLNSNISLRFHAMIEEGAIEEAAAYRARGLDPSLPSARALGAPELIAHLAGRMELAKAIEVAITATRRFAKRQRTWFRNQMPDWPRVDPAGTDTLAAVSRG